MQKIEYHKILLFCKLSQEGCAKRNAEKQYETR